MRDLPGSGIQGRPQRGWSSLGAAVVLVAVTMLTAACGGGGDGDEAQSNQPPWGLAEVQMPSTEGEVVAVFEAMPAIDGIQPALSQMGDEDFYPTATYYESEEGAFGVEVQAFPDDDPRESFNPDELEADGWNVEEYDVDPDGDLIWMAMGPSPDDEFEAFAFAWADPDGSWRFFAVADTAEFRVELVRAFIAAAGG